MMREKKMKKSNDDTKKRFINNVEETRKPAARGFKIQKLKFGQRKFEKTKRVKLINRRI